jgi:hypothetical protein
MVIATRRSENVSETNLETSTTKRQTRSSDTVSELLLSLKDNRSVGAGDEQNCTGAAGRRVLHNRETWDTLEVTGIQGHYRVAEMQCSRADD